MSDASVSAALSVLGKIVEANGRLLRVARAPRTGAAGARLSTRVRLTFDVGAVDLWVEGDTLAAGEPDEAEALLDAAEDEPWWTVLGHPLVRVAAHAPAGTLVQFRPDEASPKIFVLGVEAGAVGVRTVV